MGIVSDSRKYLELQVLLLQVYFVEDLAYDKYGLSSHQYWRGFISLRRMRKLE